MIFLQKKKNKKKWRVAENHLSCVICQVSHVTWHIPCVPCHMLRVNCHLFPVHREAGFPRWHTQTHRQTTDGHRNLETELAQRADSVKVNAVFFLGRIWLKHYGCSQVCDIEEKITQIQQKPWFCFNSCSIYPPPDLAVATVLAHYNTHKGKFSTQKLI